MSPHDQALTPPYEQAPLIGQVLPPHEQAPLGVPHQETMIQLTQAALLALIRDASPQAEEQRQEEVNSQISRPEIAQTQEQHPPQSRQPTAPFPSRGVEDPYLPLAVATPRRSPFSPAILAEALPADVKVSHLSEYNGTGDPQEHLDKFYAEIDWCDLSDTAYCKVFHTTLFKHALAWFNQLPAGTISSLKQLTQHFLHHFSMNKRVLKTAAFLFTIRQKENDLLRDYMQIFVKALHEVPHTNNELLASIIQQNLLPGRFKESIAGKLPNSLEDLLM
ncbi:hypothetical protein Sango_1750100 [Sesamum angolense]|uniref:Retrotransposon gag domain-containing protein n=1 Tax=Sesamum angolense TaxID=2727404 RepID=A0AAE2BSG8_9LAMI|nr:hypothetical protein Sango_1750100 [Sesamum angolense]